MHEDEHRDAGLTRRFLFEEISSNPESLHHAYYDLVERDERAGEREEEDRRLSERIGAMEREAADLKRRLARAHGSLEAYRKETRRLKDDLARVRGSRSLKVGRAITAPASMFRRFTAARRSASEALSELSDGRGLGVQDAPAVGSSSGKLWELTYEELENRLMDHPRADVLSALLNRAWFQRGDLSGCENLLSEYASLVDDLPAKTVELVSRIRGVCRLRDGRVIIPPRSHGAAYRVERGRIMYCTHSTPIFDSNGYSTRTRGLVSGLKESGFDISVVSRLGYPWDTHVRDLPGAEKRHVDQLDGVEYVHMPGGDINRDPLDEYLLKVADGYVREARIRRPAVIHAASNFRQALPALIAARRLGIPFVYEVRGLWELTEAAAKDGWENSERFALQVAFESIVASEADHVLAITSQVRDELVARGADRDKITLLPNAVNPNEFMPLPPDLEYARSVGVELDRPVIGFAGSLVAYEGLDILLRAVQELHEREIPAQVVIAGSGPAESGLRKLTSDLGLENDVTFLGRIPAESVPRLMSIMDVMPCPRLSTRVTEMVSPLKPLEALSAGKPVVLSDVAPHLDLVSGGRRRGLLTAAGDPSALASSLAEVLTDPDLARSVSRAGRLWVVRERTWCALSDDVNAAYGSAAVHQRDVLAKVPDRPLRTIRVGIIADEFTTETLANRVQTVPISRHDPRISLDQNLDAIFIESAWEGNGGEWHRGVGYYDETQFASLRSLLEAAKELGIPTIFWNKEDPVHYRRFFEAAVSCDHVFTTDSSLLGNYLTGGSDVVRSAASLPFYSEPTIHNPVQSPATLGVQRAMYAGTYYGERYAARSAELSSLLRSAAPYGVDIYDRQHDNPDSPYRFPKEFLAEVRGGLPYGEVLEAYRSHYVNLNVNSVTDSPTMFSRRVVEVAASGGVVLSGPGRGVVETFGGAIPASFDPAFHRALLRGWDREPAQRFNEAWFQMRTISRSHTTETALAIMFRSAGIAVDGMQEIDYVAALGTVSEASLNGIASQSVPPVAITTSAGEIALARELVEKIGCGLPVIDEANVTDWGRLHGARALIKIEGAPPRTLAEDLLDAHRWRGDPFIVAREWVDGDDARLLASPAQELPVRSQHALSGTFALLGSDSDSTGSSLSSGALSAGGSTLGLSLVVPCSDQMRSLSDATVVDKVNDGSRVGVTILIASHDLKFLEQYITYLEAQGHTVLIDQWTGHSGHDEARSKELLNRADVVWCEWGLGNAVWYSQHVASTQTLVVRIHLQEIDLPYLRNVRTDAVDTFIFVGDLIRRAAVASHGVPEDRAVVVPNFVRTDELALTKTEDAAFTLGFVGSVPQRKRLDLAIDLVERLHETDQRFRLRVKGKRPEEYSWMGSRPEELRWYRDVYERIDQMNSRDGIEVVGFDGHGDNMSEWYRGIGIVVSTSDFESFHLTLADGACSGADAVSLAWPGADRIYPESILFPDTESMVAGVLDEQARARRREDLVPTVASFDEEVVFNSFSKIMFGGG